MPLVSGARLGRFELAGLLGVGGMAEVYRARDTILQREVALKINIVLNWFEELRRLAPVN
jgi:hypothetical protein